MVVVVDVGKCQQFVVIGDCYCVDVQFLDQYLGYFYVIFFVEFLMQDFFGGCCYFQCCGGKGGGVFFEYCLFIQQNVYKQCCFDGIGDYYWCGNVLYQMQGVLEWVGNQQNDYYLYQFGYEGDCFGGQWVKDFVWLVVFDQYVVYQIVQQFFNDGGDYVI